MSGALRVFWTLVVHLVLFLVLFGLIYFLGGGEDAVATAVRNQYQDNPDTLNAIRSAAVWLLIHGCALAMAWSWVMSGIFLLAAERQRPSGPSEGAALLPLWVWMLVINLAGFALMTWSIVWRAASRLDLAPWMLNSGLLLTLFGVLLAYFLGTALAVKTVMRPSVPLSGLVPNPGRARA